MMTYNLYDNKKLKVVVSPVVASRLCDLGYYIVKIKPKKDVHADEYKCNTVFLFEETEKFLDDFYAIVAELKQNNEKRNEI